jgi:putative NIF3 family GTP cyclohydrolase 1 type 2
MAEPAGSVVTAQGIEDRIWKDLGGGWKPDTVDSFKAGDPSTVVTGIVATSLASLDVLERALKVGANLIVTCEPTFFARADSPTPPAMRGFGAASPAPSASPPHDPVFSAKNEFIEKHNLVILRMSEHWGLRTPDLFAQGLASTLGWSKFATAGDPRIVIVPETSLKNLVFHVKDKLQMRGGMRVVGDPQLRVRKVALLPGSTALGASLKALPEVDAILAGEVREWEAVEYVRDTVTLGGKKSLTLVGRIVSEEPGMQLCARWMKTIVPEVASTWLSAGDAYWRPTL